MRALAAAASIAAAAFTVPAMALAQPSGAVMHRVTPNDTIELLAAEYYGSRRHAALLRLANDIDESRELRRGQRIRIPVGLRVVAEPGDRFESIAGEHLGDEQRAGLLADYNDMNAVPSLAAGVLVRIPFHVPYTADDEVALGILAARYLGGSRDADILREYNFLDEDVRSIEAGESLLIPALHIAVRAARMPSLGEGAQARVATRRAARAEAASALPAIRHAWRRGDFAVVERRAQPLDLDFLDAEVALEISLFLGGAHVARGDLDAAESVFRAALARDPDYEMSAYHFSPAIREVWEAHGGRIDTSSR